MKNAYITVVNDKSYLKGIKALTYQINAYSKFPLIIVATNDLKEELEEFKKKKNVIVEYRDNIELNVKFNNYDYRNSHWTKTFYKFCIFEFSMYDKLVYLDSDLYIDSNVDDLFNYNHISAVSDSDFMMEERFGLNSGVLVFHPDISIYSELITCAISMVESGMVIGDQDVMSKVFVEWSIDKALHLPVYFNSNIALVDNYGESPKIVHFIGPKKPWNMNYIELIARFTLNFILFKHKKNLFLYKYLKIIKKANR